MKNLIFFALLGVTTGAYADVAYTCNANIDAAVAGTCASFNSVDGGAYKTAFTNANALIYVRFDPAAGLGQTTQVSNFVSYSTYVGALKTESTDTAASFLSNTEPALYGGGQVKVTSALGTLLGLTGMYGLTVDPGTGAIGFCSDPGGDGCYDAIVDLAPPSKVAADYGQQYYYPQQGGTSPLNAYDIDSIVEHESNEVLGTSSCVNVFAAGALSDGCGGTSPSAEDLFRYNSSGPTLLDPGGLDYFSPDGGVSKDSPYYNTILAGNDYGDFSTNCLDVQDSSGCTGPGGVLSILDDPGTPEIGMLNAVGYNLNTGATPEPSSLVLLGTGLAALGGMIRRLRIR